MTALQVTWFMLIGVLLTGYAILDGFDLGVGFWYLFSKKDEHRRAKLNAIGPTWDGNEVWLLTGGGAIFAAFPHVYATVFSGFYLALLLVLFCLIIRAVAIEFRSKIESDVWRRRWDIAFSISSILPMLLFGVALGNILRGIPLDQTMTFTGNFFTLLNPYALLIGLLGFAMLATHGAVFIALKTSDELETNAFNWAQKAWITYIGLFIVTVIATLLTQPALIANYKSFPILWILPVLGLVTIVLTGQFIRQKQAGKAFLLSSFSIASMMAITGGGLFPRLVPALNNADLNLTITNASSSPLTLKVMLIMALLGMPLVLWYTIWIYKSFSGKVDQHPPVY